MAIVELMYPMAYQTAEGMIEYERKRRTGEVPSMYRLNYMGQKIEGLKKEDLLAIMNAIYHNQEYLR